MGFDIYGIKPAGTTMKKPRKPSDKHGRSQSKWDEWFLKSNEYDKQSGTYFRNNAWWWRPLWDYVYDNCQNILTDHDYQEGCFNNGYEITAKKAKAIAKRLKSLIKNNATKEYETWRKKELDKMEQITCDLCKGTGKIDDGIIKGKCNGCNGTGKRDPWDKSYPFSADNVKNFAEFCEKSGGFTIC